jgi:hypothetical protein
MARKRALLVFPDYSTVHGFSERQLFVMQQAGVLPPSLGKYTSLGASADMEQLISILSSDFVTNVLRGQVTASDFKIALRLLLAHDTSVAVLAFCGHGVYEHAAGYHGSLVCCFNQRISAVAIEDIVAENKFRGTFVRILNMCD